MVNILLEGYELGADWLRRGLSRYLSPEHHVAVAALAFRDSQARTPEDWQSLYGPEGAYYSNITAGLRAYGISERNISFINYFADSPAVAARKAARADILYFPGGLPDRMLERIRELELLDVLKRHRGIVMGYSAGALIQLGEYYIDPDDDYPAFGYCEGLAYIDGFYLQVHYEGADSQREAIRRALSERGKPVYALSRGAGGLIVDGGRVQTLGDVQLFSCDERGAHRG